MCKSTMLQPMLQPKIIAFCCAGLLGETGLALWVRPLAMLLCVLCGSA